MLGGEVQRQLYVQMMEQEEAGGWVSLDHVFEVAKRMKSSHKAMLIAVGASGVVLGFWNVHSTSLRDVEQQLKQLDARERQRSGGKVRLGRGGSLSTVLIS